VPFELFKYALFSVAFGAITIIYKWISDKIQDNRLEKQEFTDNVKLMREEAIAIHVGLKAFRRELRARGEFVPKKFLKISKKDFFELFSEFNKVQHRLESLLWRMKLIETDLGTSADKVTKELRKVEKFTDKLLNASSLFDNLNFEKPIVLKAPNDLFHFIQPATSENLKQTDGFYQTDENLFQPMEKVRSILKKRTFELQKSFR